MAEVGRKSMEGLRLERYFWILSLWGRGWGGYLFGCCGQSKGNRRIDANCRVCVCVCGMSFIFKPSVSLWSALPLHCATGSALRQNSRSNPLYSVVSMNEYTDSFCTSPSSRFSIFLLLRPFSFYFFPQCILLT